MVRHEGLENALKEAFKENLNSVSLNQNNNAVDIIAQTIEALTDKIVVQDSERVVAANEAKIKSKKANKRNEVLKSNRDLDSKKIKGLQGDLGRAYEDLIVSVICI